jgi:hypothetical protein
MSRAGPGLVLVAFAALALGVYRDALDGPFVSDDHGYLTSNRWVQALDAEGLREILDPRGAVAVYTANYAPVHVLLHALEWRIFGPRTRGYHLVNVLLHACVSALLAWLLVDWGVPRAASTLGAAVFLLHPANVEAVAWISQLKTTASLGLALGALLAHPRRPWLGALLFALALLTKIQVVFALPAAFAIEWARRGRAGAAETGAAAGLAAPARFGWLAAWLAVLALVAVPEWLAFQRLGDTGRPLHPDAAVVARSIAAIGARYLAMAATSFGVSAFHAPPPAVSLADPWWLAGIAVAPLLAWRTLATLRAARPEAAFWVWAAAAWAPVSQVFPFVHPMGDRYLYFILPGLLGAVLLAAQAPLLRAEAALAERRTVPAQALLGLLVALAVVFGARSAERAGIWRSEGALLVDAARHYPDGIEAQLLAAMQAAARGDAAAAAAAARAATARGYDSFDVLRTNPAFESVRGSAEFRAAIAETAERWLANVADRGELSQAEEHMRGRAELARGDPARAIEALERALALPGPYAEPIRASLLEARGELRRRERSASGG